MKGGYIIQILIIGCIGLILGGAWYIEAQASSYPHSSTEVAGVPSPAPTTTETKQSSTIYEEPSQPPAGGIKKGNISYYIIIGLFIIFIAVEVPIALFFIKRMGKEQKNTNKRIQEGFQKIEIGFQEIQKNFVDWNRRMEIEKSSKGTSLLMDLIPKMKEKLEKLEEWKNKVFPMALEKEVKGLETKLETFRGKLFSLQQGKELEEKLDKLKNDINEQLKSLKEDFERKSTGEMEKHEIEVHKLREEIAEMQSEISKLRERVYALQEKSRQKKVIEWEEIESRHKEKIEDYIRKYNEYISVNERFDKKSLEEALGRFIYISKNLEETDTYSECIGFGVKMEEDYLLLFPPERDRLKRIGEKLEQFFKYTNKEYINGEKPYAVVAPAVLKWEKVGYTPYRQGKIKGKD